MVFFLFFYFSNLFGAPTRELICQYQIHSTHRSDIYVHLPQLRELARESASVVEIGVRNIVSTWGILMGLAEQEPSSPPSYLGIDLFEPPNDRFLLAKSLSESNGIRFQFWKGNDFELDLEEPVDMLFIDSLHTYAHLTYELEKFSPKVKKYIAMHDTGEPFGFRDLELKENPEKRILNYPAWISKDKRGLWAAVVDFIERHPEWKIKYHTPDCYGFTVLELSSQ